MKQDFVEAVCRSVEFPCEKFEQLLIEPVIVEQYYNGSHDSFAKACEAVSQDSALFKFASYCISDILSAILLSFERLKLADMKYLAVTHYDHGIIRILNSTHNSGRVVQLDISTLIDEIQLSPNNIKETIYEQGKTQLFNKQYLPLIGMIAVIFALYLQS